MSAQTPPSRALHLPLYVRIWLAVVLAVAVLTLLTGWVMRMAAEPPLREVVVRNASGDLVGEGKARLHAPAPQGSDMPHPPGHFGAGPEFMVHMHNGELMHVHLPRAPHSFWSRPPFGLAWTLGLVGLVLLSKQATQLQTTVMAIQRWRSPISPAQRRATRLALLCLSPLLLLGVVVGLPFLLLVRRVRQGR